jgi:RES domain-containing protein
MQRARGRWNLQRPRISCLYTSYTAEGALAEYDRMVASRPAYRHSPRDLVSVLIDVEPVLDLTDPVNQARYGITREAMLSSRYTACHRVVRRAILTDGFRGIRAPSAAAPHELNLMVFPENQSGRLLTSDGPDRLPLNHGRAPLRP